MKEKQNIKKKAIVRFIYGVLVILFGIVETIGFLCIELDIDDLIPLILIFILPTFIFGVILLKNANTYKKAIKSNSIVMAQVSEIEKKEIHDSEDSYTVYRVYVNYKFNGISYENICWYGASDLRKTKSRFKKELSQFPKKDEIFQVYINPYKPYKILSNAPFSIW